jgi:hypothetical protein
MKHQPRIQERADQPYLAIPLTVTMEGEFGEEVKIVIGVFCHTRS